MTTLMRYDPFFHESLSLRDAMNRLFEQSFVPWSWGTTSTTAFAPMNAYETDQGYQVQVLLPGVKPEDIDLTVQQNTLTIKGQYQPFQEQGKQVYWLIQEIGSGSFERTITFPKAIEADKVETSYENGILTISVPVSEVSRPKRISIGGGQKKELTVEAGSR